MHVSTMLKHSPTISTKNVFANPPSTMGLRNTSSYENTFSLPKGYSSSPPWRISRSASETDAATT